MPWIAVPFKKPRPYNFRVRVGETLTDVSGWESSLAMAIVQDEAGFQAVMLMNGLVLAGPFPSLDQAHAFCVAAVGHPKLFVGTPFLEEFFERAGGRDEAQRIVNSIVEAAKQEKHT